MEDQHERKSNVFNDYFRVGFGLALLTSGIYCLWHAFSD